MHWAFRWPELFLAVLLVALEACRWGYSTVPGIVEAGWSAQRKLDNRNKVKELWYHGYSSYMRYAFPLDELTPLSCSGRGPDWHAPDNIAYNDVAGNFSLTLIDSLDTLVVLNDRQGFEDGVRKVIDWVTFDVNTKPQIFEANIRVLGGLLSAHIFANHTGQPFHLPWYRGELLAMARDLGERFLPAFATPTGLPYARINLRHGIPAGESAESCTAGAGSLILEFATLSRLTGDSRFEKAAHKAFFALWNRRSDIGLVGNTINVWTGNWIYPEVSSVGAGIDSFFEYALKWYILSGEHEFLDVWNESYAAIMRYARSTDGLWFRRVNIYNGEVVYGTLDSLSAFWPGLQVLAGDVDNAIKSHMLYWELWKRHAGLPEVWDMNYKQATAMQYPLRPEFIESTWYLYRATQDTSYLDIGERVLRDISLRSKVECGLTGIQDLRTNARDDRMESFVLSETLKYLYLLFDEENPLHTDDSNYVFTTEGHILWLDQQHLKATTPAVRQLRRAESPQCPAYEPPTIGDSSLGHSSLGGLTLGVRSRSDVDYSRQLVGNLAMETDAKYWHASGWCEKPEVDPYTFEFILSADGKAVTEDVSPSLMKIASTPDGFIVQSVTGIRARIVARLDGKGYDMAKLGPHTVHTGQIVYLNDSALSLTAADGLQAQEENARASDVQLRFYMDYLDAAFDMAVGGSDLFTELVLTAHPGMFGGNPSIPDPDNERPLRFGRGEGVTLVRDPLNPFGCKPYDKIYSEEAIFALRGECTFLEKLLFAQAAGASGVVVLGTSEAAVNPSAGADELHGVEDRLEDVAIVVIKQSDGRLLAEMLDNAEKQGIGRVVLALDQNDGAVARARDADEREGWRNKSDKRRVLYVNGRPLLNTVLMI
ncbi:glycoside hydrolase family 47 protein [Auriscalpium vulgare]|uniref:Glycoside hydrolase family 47 protein n=1 Tax=Auriscalpium vulgare TaxID=40419 RepID=A0ACB8S0U4_9AGAM|nr:glycoside hydrolase family 47 protein [Auriscalpium vulgare]